MANPGDVAQKAVDVAKEAKDTAEDVSRQPWVEWLSRFGYIIRGVLYIVVGILALQAALGQGGATTDIGGAITAIGGHSLGTFLLILVAIGLVGYSAWGFIRAIFDPLKRGTDPKGIAQRIGYVVSGLSYGALLFPTVRFLLHDNSDDQGGGSSHDWTAAFISQPLGQWLVILFGLIGIGGGLGQLWLAFSADFQKDLKYGEMSEEAQTWTRRIGRAGYAARAVIFVLIGFFLAKAALSYDPKEARGLDGALLALAQQTYGPWLLGAVAVGLIAFGVFSILSARWQRMTSS
jgi:hypothetical protein